MFPGSSAPTANDPQAAPRAWFAPGSVYLSGEDNLRIRSLNAATGVTLNVAGRTLNLDNQVRSFQFDHTPNTDRTAATTIGGLGPGWLLNFRVAITAGSPINGQCWVLVELVRGQTGATHVLGVLSSGYVTAQQPIGWPGATPTGTHAGDGVVRSITGTDPAANVEVSETVPTGARWHLLAVSVSLVTDANVANRFPQLVIDDGATTIFAADPAAAQAASLTRRYNASVGGERLDSVDTNKQWSLPIDLPLLAGYRIRTATTNRQATDNFGAPQLLVREWLEGN